jgi:hypothetical protein
VGTLAATLSAARKVQGVEGVLTFRAPRANSVPTPELQTFTVPLA